MCSVYVNWVDFRIAIGILWYSEAQRVESLSERRLCGHFVRDCRIESRGTLKLKTCVRRCRPSWSKKIS